MLTNKIYPINLVTWHNLGIKYLLAAHNLREEFCIEPYSSKPKQNPAPKARQNYAPTPNLNKENNQNFTKHAYLGNKAQENTQSQTQPRINTAQPSINTAQPSINTAQPSINTAHSPEINAAHNAENNTQGLKKSAQINNAGLAPRSKTLPLHEWPKVWKELLSNKNSAKVIWTYTGLGDDISGQGIPERKELIRRLIKELAFPAGTHAFWPLSLPSHEDQELNAQIFWSSAQMLEARAIVIMGSTALKSFNFPRKLRPLQQTVYNGYMLIVLPDINFLINEMQKYAPVREFIRTALKNYVQG